MTYYDDDDAAYDAWKDDQAWADDFIDDSAAPLDDTPRPKRLTQILEEPF